MADRWAIRNARIVRPEGVFEGDVLVEGERITDVGTNISADSIGEVVDANGKYLFPGAIDPHTHMGIPIKDGWSADDFRTGSRAALHGGVTTILDFTHLEAEETIFQSVTRRCNQAKTSHADVALHVNVTRADDATLVEIPALVARGHSSFKVFTTYREAGMMLEYEEIERVAEVVREAGGLLMAHAEDDEVIRKVTSKLDVDASDPWLHGVARPPEAERVAVEHLVAISNRTGCPLYIVHLSSPGGLEAAKVGDRVKLETCPQYLFLDDSQYKREDGRMYVASPALRSREEADRMLAALVDGKLDTLGTDHCPFKLADKKPGLPFGRIPNGMGGVETLVPLLLAHYVSHQIDVAPLAAMLSENAAKIFGLAPFKGRIDVGADADMFLVDPEELRENGEGIARETASDWDAYAGLPLLFPDRVWRRGEMVVRDQTLQSPGPGVRLAAKAFGCD